jgi:hypothetical protein
VSLTKLLINSLTVTNFDLRNFESPSLQHFYCTLQGHALNEQNPQDKIDTLQPDQLGFKKYDDVFKMTQETVDA